MPGSNSDDGAKFQKYAIEGMKALTLLNGGAITAFIAFVGYLTGDGNSSAVGYAADVIGNSHVPILLFASGLVAAIVMLGFSYLSELLFSAGWPKLQIVPVVLAILCGLGSSIFFGWGHMKFLLC